ncbi:DDE family transposase, partial [Scopulibacillus darangshiensis]
MTSVTDQAMEFNKRVKINFDGGDLTSESGLLLYKEFDEKMGLSDLIR